MRGNPDYWTGQQVSDYERKQRLLVPRKDEMLDTIVALMPFESEQTFTVLDVGAGQGALSARLLERFPHAEAVLFDYECAPASAAPIPSRSPGESPSNPCIAPPQSYRSLGGSILPSCQSRRSWIGRSPRAPSLHGYASSSKREPAKRQRRRNQGTPNEQVHKTANRRL